MGKAMERAADHAFQYRAYETEVETTLALGTEDREKLRSKTKTVYLIRHAESNENRRQASLSRSLKRIGSLSMPSKQDVSASVELLDLPAQIDSDVSQVGRAQIAQMGVRLRKDKFLVEKGIQLVAHSPLKRARQTSEGMLGCVTTRHDALAEEDSSHLGKRAATVGRVVELPCLTERTPLEWLPVNHDAFTKRIAAFERWLGSQEEDVIAVVGHSHFFKYMLGLNFKFGNCSVYELQFNPNARLSESSVKADVRVLNEAERKVKLKKIAKSLSSVGSRSMDEEEKKDASNHAMYTDEGESLSLSRGWSAMANLYQLEPLCDINETY